MKIKHNCSLTCNNSHIDINQAFLSFLIFKENHGFKLLHEELLHRTSLKEVMSQIENNIFK